MLEELAAIAESNNVPVAQVEALWSKAKLKASKRHNEGTPAFWKDAKENFTALVVAAAPQPVAAMEEPKEAKRSKKTSE